MINGMTILAIIPARGGSKGLPGKNIKEIDGKPLIAWTIEQGLESKYIDKLIVSTDDEGIAKISKKFGAEVPFLRPPKYAGDDSPSYEAILHALEELANNNEKFDYLCLLEPTSPLRKLNDIDNALLKLINSVEADSLISVGEVHMEHPGIVKKINENGLIVPYMKNSIKLFQRQQADKVYFPYGVIYACKTNIYQTKRTFYLEKTIPYLIERWQNYEIDDYLDYLIIETILKKFKEKING